MKNLSIVTVALSLAWVVLTAVAAGAAQNPARCAELQQDATRLACYDAIFRSNNSLPGIPSVAAESTDPGQKTAAPNTAAAASFGQEQVKRRKVARSNPAAPAKARTLDAIITRLAKGARKEWLFYLDNGQLWKQQSDRYLRVQAGDRVTLKRGRFGGYILLTARGMSTKVIRLN